MFSQWSHELEPTFGASSGGGDSTISRVLVYNFLSRKGDTQEMVKRVIIYLKRWFKSHKVIAVLALVIPTIIFVTFPRFTKISPSFSHGLKSVKTLGKTETKFIKTADNAFNLIFSKCPNSDEIRPKKYNCVNYSGFSSSIVESLEALYTLGLKDDYEKAKEFTLKRLDCDNLEWVNTHEFWARGIGSLIGAYHVTNDKVFLERARKCAKKALQISPFSSPYDYMNLKESIGKNTGWSGGTIVADIYAGYPEVLALATLLNDNELLDEVNDLESGVFDLVRSGLPMSYNLTDRRSTQYSIVFDGYHAEFVQRLAIALAIRENAELSDAIHDIARKMRFPDKYRMETYYPLMDVSDIMNSFEDEVSIPILDNVTFFAKSTQISGKLNGLRITDIKTDYSFNFESVAIRSLARNAIKEKNDRQLKTIKSAFLSVVVSLASGKGVVGLKSSIKQVVQKGTVMPSNLFGQWLFHGSLLYADHNEVLENGVFNERGHLLMCNSIHPFKRTK